MSLKLEPLIDLLPRNGPLVLIIMDGVGIGKKDKGDCVYNASLPNLNSLIEWSKKYSLYTQLKAHGKAVGLPSDKDIGNSEVGHNAMGAGRVFSQGAELVNQAIDKGTIFETSIWKKLVSISEVNTFHLIGLLSDGNVHSHINHLFALLTQLAKTSVKRVRVHILHDGRDVAERSALQYVQSLEKKLAELNKNYAVDYKIASGGGRMRVTMDRYESDWNVVKRGWDAHVRGIPEKFESYSGYFRSAEEAINLARKLQPETNDQYLPSFVISNEKNIPIGTIKNGDSVVYFNFRGDRALQISKAFEDKAFNKFDRIIYPQVNYAGMLEYDHEEKIPKHYLVEPPQITLTIGEYLSTTNITQYACSETHKFGHVTYFWNGNRTGYINPNLEYYEEVMSEPTELIVKNPAMKAIQVGDALLKAMDSGKYKFLRINFANGDMAGHTGIIDVTIKSLEAMDKAIGKIKSKIDELGGVLLITADHGNAEEKLENNNPKTSHTVNPVPFIIYDPHYKGEYILNKVNEPQLANLASTLLFYLGFKAPKIYYPSLVVSKE